jgi:YYY domain-containing protein
MLQFISWYLLITLIGWLTFPLAYRLFPALSDRGFSLARALGMLVWGYIFWMMASLGIIQNDGSGLLLALLLLAVISGIGLWRNEARQSIGQWIKSNLKLIVTVELLFFFAFAFLAFVRSGNPEIVGTEKPMELAFINAVLHSPTFPPHDPWLSGYAISYYYFGYVMTAMLAMATSTLGSVAFNLMLALVFALSALGAYGVIYNLLGLRNIRKPNKPPERDAENPGFHLSLPLLGPLFLLLVSNFEGFLEVLSARGIFWKFNLNGTAASSAFWKWLDIQDLRNAPLKTSWLPDRYYWWWRASRVITETNLAGRPNEIIDEFPFFSYLLGDLHPHILAMPFGLLAVAVALNLYLGGWKGEIDLGFYRLPLRPSGILFGAMLLGGLAFLNTWDILTGFGLLVGAFVLARVFTSGWSWNRLVDLLAFGIPLGVLAILLYLPFYAGFSSQAGGIIPNLEFSTRGAQLWVMFGPLLLPIFAYLFYLWRVEKRPVNGKAGLGLALGFALLLWAFSWLLALLAQLRMPDFVAAYLADEGFQNAAAFFSAATMRRLINIGSLLTVLATTTASLAFLIPARAGMRENEETNPQGGGGKEYLFAVFLVLLASLLVLAPEFVYLRDQFGDRMNTIFKFYYQAWLLWSLAAAFGVATLLMRLRGTWNWVNRIGLTLVLLMALVYPVLGLLTKTEDFRIPAFINRLTVARALGETQPQGTAFGVWTLDGSAIFQPVYPDDLAAAAWLQAAPQGIIVEATKTDASYSDYGHISIFSGLPTVLGWPMHEAQWRGSYAPQGSRLNDVRQLYESSSWDTTTAILQQYHIRYVFIGTLEHQTYHINEQKFQLHLTPVFQQGQVVIYEVPLG